MRRSDALVIVTRQIQHNCPYKGQNVPIALCYIKSQDVAERDLCYGCDQIESLKERYGLRTFRRRIEVSPCKHCTDGAALHDADSGKCTRCGKCPGYEPIEESGNVYVPTNVECTEWMVVDVATGVRTPYVIHRAKWDGERNARRFQLPLLGAPGTVPSDSRDDIRLEAAAYAEKRRGAPRSISNDEENDKRQNTSVKIRGRRKKTK